MTIKIFDVLQLPYFWGIGVGGLSIHYLENRGFCGNG